MMLQKRLKSRKGSEEALRRQTSEEDELAKKDVITLQDILNFKYSTKNYLCSKESNIYGLQFTSSILREVFTGRIIYEIIHGNNKGLGNIEIGITRSPGDYTEPQLENIAKITLPAYLLLVKKLAITFEFTNGNTPIKEFKMLERHYFRDILLRGYQFNFGFCMPNSTNTYEHIYAVPRLPRQLLRQMICNPFQTCSDTFFFAEEKLIFHSKMAYRYEGKLP